MPDSVDLREYLERIIADVDKRYEQRFSDSQEAIKAALTAVKEGQSAALFAQQDAVRTALIATDKRFDNTNEWRGSVTDILATAMPRGEAAAILNAMDQKQDALAARIDKIEGRGGGLHSMWGYVVGLIGLAGILYTAYKAK